MGKLRRLRYSLGMVLRKGEKKRAYCERHHLFALYGNKVVFQPHVLPLYSELIRLHDNVIVGRNVEFVTHDMLHRVFNLSPDLPSGYKERVGCVEVMENCFIGNGAIILHGVRIAQNCIIAAGSVVTKSTEPGGVYAGVPARRIGDYFETAEKRLQLEQEGAIATVAKNQSLTPEEIERAWRLFDGAQ